MTLIESDSGDMSNEALFFPKSVSPSLTKLCCDWVVLITVMCQVRCGQGEDKEVIVRVNTSQSQHIGQD